MIFNNFYGGWGVINICFVYMILFCWYSKVHQQFISEINHLNSYFLLLDHNSGNIDANIALVWHSLAQGSVYIRYAQLCKITDKTVLPVGQYISCCNTGMYKKGIIHQENNVLLFLRICATFHTVNCDMVIMVGMESISL